MKENILLIHRSLGLGGAEKIFAFLANALAEEGYNVEVMLLTDTSETLFLDNRIVVKTNNCYSDSPIVGKKMLYGLKKLKHMSDIISNETISFNAKLIICFDLRILLALSISMRKLDARVLFSERADPFYNPKYWSWILKSIYKKIDYIVFQTEQAADFYGASVKNKSCIIPNPAFPRTMTEPKTTYFKEPYIFSAGRFQHRKGFDLLIQAFSLIHNDFPEYKLIIYGEGEDEKLYRDLIQSNNITDYVELRKPLNGVVEKNRNATLFVLPSRSEGIPNILIEAIIEGIPCVSAKCSPGGAELISDNGKYCLLAENDDYFSLAEKIRYSLSHYEEILSRVPDAKASMNRFEPNYIKSCWIEVVEKVLL